MCGRITLHTPPARLARLLRAQLAADVDPDTPPSWNVAPSTDVLAVVERKPRPERTGAGGAAAEGDEGAVRRLVALRWGLVPFWAKDPSIGNKMINARAESLERRPAFRRLLAGHRCLVVADGFYEWRPLPGRGRKQPYYFTRADGRPLTLAGLWDGWRDPTVTTSDRGETPHLPTVLRTCTIVTTSAGPDVAFAHDRMPVVVEPATVDRWLDPDNDDADVDDLLEPSPGGILVSHPVGQQVSRVENDGPDLIVPLEGAPAGSPSDRDAVTGPTRDSSQPSLF